MTADPALGKPHVVVHVAISVDGCTAGFPVDLGVFYGLAGTWHEDVTLSGADTFLAQEAAMADAPQPGPAAGGPLLAVVDSRARVHGWPALRNMGYWSEVLALSSARTPARKGEDVEEFVCGQDRVDLVAALDELGRRGARLVRVDSGGRLTGALLAAGLVDEVSLLVHPVLAGVDHRWFGDAGSALVQLELISCERLDGGVVWLRYDVRP